MVAVINEIFKLGGVFSRNGSGALSLAHVADQRYSGYIEHHMNAWDYLAGQLIVKEAGGLVEEQNAQEMIDYGGRVSLAGLGYLSLYSKWLTTVSATTISSGRH